MPVTAREILEMPTVNTYQGFSRTVFGMIDERDSSVMAEDEFNFSSRYADDTPEALALEARLTTLVKAEDIVDGGDGRTAIDVVCLDAKPIAIVGVEGYDRFDYDVAPLDLNAIDEVVESFRLLFKRHIREMSNVDMDQDVSKLLGLRKGISEETVSPVP